MDIVADLGALVISKCNQCGIEIGSVREMKVPREAGGADRVEVYAVSKSSGDIAKIVHWVRKGFTRLQSVSIKELLLEARIKGRLSLGEMYRGHAELLAQKAKLDSIDVTIEDKPV